MSELLFEEAPSSKFEDGSQVELLDAKFVDWHPLFAAARAPAFFN